MSFCSTVEHWPKLTVDYSSGRVALCHHEVLHLALSATRASGDSSARDVTTIYENGQELQEAASGVTECLKELIQLRLARWLPISAVACTALPLVLHILDVKLSSPRPGTANTNGQNTQAALKQHRLTVLIEAMKTYQPQYDSVDYVSETIRHIVNLVQLDGVQPSASEGGSSSHGDNETAGDSTGNAKMQDWADILTSHPSLYLRLALTMDLSLSKGRLPEERDFPASLRGLLASGSASSLKRIFGGANNQQQQQLRPVPGSMSSITPQVQRPKSFGPPQPRVVAPIHTMKQWVENDRAVSDGIQAGIAMDLDEPAPGGRPESVGYSDSESGSQTGSCSSDTEEHGNDRYDHQHGQSVQTESGTDTEQQQESSFQPFTIEEMEVLEAHVLDAFTLHNESPPSSDGAVNVLEVFGEALGIEAVEGWFQQIRNQDEVMHGVDREDIETARVLIGATNR